MKVDTGHDIVHFAYEFYSKLNTRHRLNNAECAGWIKLKTYEDSIFKVIPDAMADCVMKKAEFADEKIVNNVVKS